MKNSKKPEDNKMSQGNNNPSPVGVSNNHGFRQEGSGNYQSSSQIPNSTGSQSSTVQQTTMPPKDGPSIDPNEVITTPHTPTKYGGKKVIATIFSIIFLVAAVTIGVYLVQQQQRLQQMASSGRECQQSSDCILLDNPGNQGSFDAPRTIAYVLITDKDVHRYDKGETDDGCRKVIISENYVSWNKYGSGSNCKDVSNVQIWLGQPQPSSTPIPTQLPSATPTTPPGITPTNIPTQNPSPSPTLPPEISAQCSSVTAYDTNWNQLSINDLSALSAGDVVRFTVSGTTSNGTFDKARFEVNGTSIGESSTKKPGSDEFFKEYTIPANTSSFEVKGEIYHSSLGWI